MSSFKCEHCGADIIDSPTGYVTECPHWPIERKEKAMKEVTFSVTLTEDEAWAAAERVKRMGFSDYRQKAVSDDEAYAMRDADEKLRQALTEAGYTPR